MAVLSAGTLNGNATRDGSAARAPTRQYPRAIEDAVHLRQFATRLRETARTQSVRTTHRHLAATLWPGFIAEMQQPIGPRIQRYAGNPWPWMGSLLTCSRVTLADRAETPGRIPPGESLNEADRGPLTRINRSILAVPAARLEAFSTASRILPRSRNFRKPRRGGDHRW